MASEKGDKQTPLPQQNIAQVMSLRLRLPMWQSSGELSGIRVTTGLCQGCNRIVFGVQFSTIYLWTESWLMILVF